MLNQLMSVIGRHMMLFGVVFALGFALLAVSTSAVVIENADPAKEGKREAKEWRETTHDGWEAENRMEGRDWENLPENRKEGWYESWAHEIWEFSDRENGEKQHEGRKELFRERDKQKEIVPVENVEIVPVGN